MMTDSQYAELNTLACDILNLSRNTLVVNLRFMDRALSMLKLSPMPKDRRGTIETRGALLAFDPRFILREFKAERERVTRDYLHMVLHCVFWHPFVGTALDSRLWNLACDMAVENVITGLDLPCAAAAREERQRIFIETMSDTVSVFTAEKIYSRLREMKLSDEVVEEMAAAFRADDHSCWYLPDERDSKGRGSRGGAGDRDSLKKEWGEVSFRMQADLESFNRKRGDGAGSLMQELHSVTRERYDYTEFLKSFAVLGETVKINDDEFDYIFYTYGMKLYENMPLIEPLEYKEVKRVREFVIAIDTSGSVQGELVRRFITKTYNILMQEESFFTKINLHIIQCDARVQEDAKITCREDFDRYLRKMKIRGMGGTDFRPVFDYVEKLKDEGGFVNLKGLIYFTDGKGTFPEYRPDFTAAFVFVKDGCDGVNVPPWAIKLVLQSEEI